MVTRPVGARWATFSMYLCNGFGFGAWAASIAPLKIHLGLTPSALSLALLAVAIGAVTMMQFAGTLVVRLGGTGRTTRLAALAYVPVCVLPTLAPSLPVLILCTAMLGAISGLMDVSMNAHAAAVEKLWGRPIMSSFHAGFSLGGLAGNGFGALAIAAGVPTPFLLLPAGALIAVVVLAAVSHLGKGEVPKTHGGIFQVPERALWALGLIILCSFLVEGAMADWGGVYLTTIGVSPAAATAGFGAFSVTMVTGRVLGDFVVRMLGRVLVVRCGALLATAGLILAVAVPTLPAIVSGFALVGLGLANVVPAVFSQAASRGKTAAAGIAAVSTLGYGGMLAGPPLIGAVATGWSLRVGVIVMAAFALVAALTAFWQKGR